LRTQLSHRKIELENKTRNRQNESLGEIDNERLNKEKVLPCVSKAAPLAATPEHAMTLVRITLARSFLDG
jgi:hypothetical protein